MKMILHLHDLKCLSNSKFYKKILFYALKLALEQRIVKLHVLYV
jgi:hypothetical protein